MDRRGARKGGVIDFLASSVRIHPDRIALTDGRRSWSFRALDARVRAASARLGRLGARPGRPAALVASPSADAVVALHALFRAGTVLAPLNPELGPEAMGEALGRLDPSPIVVDEAAGRVVEEATGGVGTARIATLRGVVAGGGSGGPSEAATTGGGSGADAGGVAAVLWTSGTSGRPRGVLVTGDGLRRSAVASATRLELGPDDRWYASLSPSHVGGLALVTRAALLGSALVATGSFRAQELSRLMDDGRVTHASLVPTMLRRLLDHRNDRPPPPGFRCLLVGGAPCPPPLLDRALAAGVPVALTYGLTEATSQVTTAPPSLVRRKPGTLGAPLDGVELRVDDSGEILVRGPTVAAGFFGSPETLSDADGWLRTGDLGVVDADGHLRVIGRRSDRIITGGVNVDPMAVEAVLLRHPDVAEAGVVGLPDDEWGERVEAAIVVRAGRSGDPRAVRAWVRERLGGPRAPKRVTVLKALPRNPNGKVDRSALRRELGRTDDP